MITQIKTTGNNFTQKILEIKLNEYIDKIKKIKNGRTRIFYNFREKDANANREAFKKTLANEIVKIKYLPKQSVERKWGKMSEGCIAPIQQYTINTEIPELFDTPAVREAILFYDIRNLDTLKKISAGGLAALDSVTFNLPKKSGIANIYEYLRVNEKKKENTVFVISDNRRYNLEDEKRRLENKKDLGIDYEEEIEIPEEFANSKFFKEMSGSLRRKPAQKRKRHAK